MRKHSPSNIAWRSSAAAFVLLSLGTTVACMAPPPASSAESAAAAGEPQGSAAGDSSEPYALLEGPMGKLDGEQLPETGQPARVSPGCHTVTTNRSAVMPVNGGVVKVFTPPMSFALVFEPRYHYLIERTVTSVDSQGNGGDVSLRTVVHVRDPSGAMVREIQPVTPEYATWYCKNSK